ncbi:MAG: hypothetical protein ACLR2E_01250 [Lachnospiraceae bacterium]
MCGPGNLPWLLAGTARKGEHKDGYRRQNHCTAFTEKSVPPAYSEGLPGLFHRDPSEKNKKGLTLVRFWDEYLSYEWRNTVHGRLIWRISGSRNRYHSEICNRRADFPLYEVYIQEVLDGLTAESFGKQLRLLKNF